MRYDIDTYDRCRDDDPNKSYDFPMRCMMDLIEGDRPRENRERVSKANAQRLRPVPLHLRKRSQEEKRTEAKGLGGEVLL